MKLVHLVQVLFVALALSVVGCSVSTGDGTTDGTTGGDGGSGGSGGGGGSGTASISGIVTNATDGLGLSGATISVDGASQQGTSGSDGAFSVTGIASGDQTIRVSASGFSDYTVDVSLQDDTNTDLGVIALSENLATGELRVVLSWGEFPSDLDLHAWVPDGTEIAYYSLIGDGISLDVDDTSSFGPETITISEQQDGTYNFFVHNYSGSGSTSIFDSGARIDVYDGDGLITSVTPDSGCDNSKDYWHVVDINGGSVTTINECSTEAPTPSWDGSGGGGGGGTATLTVWVSATSITFPVFVTTNDAYWGMIESGSGSAPTCGSSSTEEWLTGYVDVDYSLVVAIDDAADTYWEQEFFDLSEGSCYSLELGDPIEF